MSTAQYRSLISFSSGFETCEVLRGKVVSPSPNTQPGESGLRIHGPREKSDPAIPLEIRKLENPGAPLPYSE